MEDLRRNPQTEPDTPDTTIQHTPLEDNQRQAQRDEEAALRSLDDTTLRTMTMPQPVPLWEPDEPAATKPAEPTSRRRVSTFALVCAVAVVSFVAGGVTARLSSQMPLLFPQKSEPQTEVAATYTPQAPKTNEHEEEVEDPDPAPTTSPVGTPEYDETDTDTHGQTETPEAPTYRWDFDDEGDRSVSYDTEHNRVTFDYDGYLFSMDLDELMAEPDGDADIDQTTSEPETSNPNRYDNDTGYDTNYWRNDYGWTRQIWGGSWT